MASIGPAALATVLGPAPLYYGGMAWWGFAFWMGVPGVLQMLVDRSLEPSERAGDGQGVLALGRASGPERPSPGGGSGADALQELHVLVQVADAQELVPHPLPRRQNRQKAA